MIVTAALAIAPASDYSGASAKDMAMNMQETGGGEARIRYDDADFTVIKAGSYVVCAVTGARIGLQALKYWNVDRQEAYVDAGAALKGFGLARE